VSSVATNTAYLTLQIFLDKADRPGYFSAHMQVPRHQSMTTARVDFYMPIDDADLAKFLPLITDQSAFVGERGIAEREAKKLGKALFEALFHRKRTHDDTLEYLHRCLRAAEEYGGLRIQLTFLEGASQIINLPWEYMCEDISGPFLLQSVAPPIVMVRYIDTKHTESYAGVTIKRPPLRALVVISSPKDNRLAPLNSKGEWTALQKAVQGMERDITLDLVEDATLDSLRSQLNKRPDYYDIVHFIGHGGFDPVQKKVVLVFEKPHEKDEHGEPDEVSAERFAAMLAGHKYLNLVILDCCKGAYSLPNDMFTGVAQSLEQQGVPAVVAMQFEVTDDAATTFASAFYETLGRWRPIEDAFAEGRKALIAHARGIEWGTPVMYMRPLEGYLFEREVRPIERIRSQIIRYPAVSGLLSFGVLSAILVPLLLWPRPAGNCTIDAPDLNVRRGPHPTNYVPPIITLQKGAVITPVAIYARYAAGVPTPKVLQLSGASTPESLWLKIKLRGSPSEGWVSYFYVPNRNNPEVVRVSMSCTDELNYLRKLPVITEANIPPTDTPRPTPSATMTAQPTATPLPP
jgi:hypothetical protein